MIGRLIGRLAMWYAVNAPEHRGKFRVMSTLDRLFGPFQLRTPDGVRLSVFVSSLMDVSYFRAPSRPDADYGAEIDRLPRTLVEGLRPGDVFVDIGANIGFLSLLAARRVGPKGLVLAVEPSAREYGRLLENLSMNTVTNVVSMHVAFGDADGLLEFQVAPYHTGLNRLAPGGANGRAGTTRVPVFRGAAPLGELLRGRQVALVKIDVEGAEVQVLRGLREFLSRTRPPKVVVEITPRFLEEFGTSREELYSIMRESGYVPQLDHRCDQFDELFVPADDGRR